MGNNETEKKDIKLTVKYSEEFREGLLQKVQDLDAEVYSWNKNFIGNIENMRARYRAFKKCMVCLMDGNDLAGYICFIPVKDKLWDRIMGDEDHIKVGPERDKDGNIVPGGKQYELIPDDDIEADDIIADPFPEKMILTDMDGKGYIKGGEEKGRTGEDVKLFVISVAIKKYYRDNVPGVTDMLTDAWIEYMNLLQKCIGRKISAISAVAVSEGGRNFLRSRQFHIARECKDQDNDIVFVCDGDCLEHLLNGKYYTKTFRDDVFIMLPFEADESEKKLKNIPTPFTDLSKKEKHEIPYFTRYLLEKISTNRQYECKNEVSRELTEHYLGEFMFLHTLDDYLDEEDPANSPTILGEEPVQISLIMHRKTQMYLVILAFNSSRFSTSQIFDQCSKDYLKIRSKDWIEAEKDGGFEISGVQGENCGYDLSGIKLSKGVYHYAKVSDYLKAVYGLIPAGSGKGLTCMTGEPRPQHGEKYVEYKDKKTTREMMNILAGETYFSLFQNFRINSEDMMECATKNRGIYDHNTTYISENIIAFILTEDGLKDLNPDEELAKEYKIQKDDKRFRALAKIDLSASLLFITELVMFQNIALAKMTSRVSKALSQAGKVPWEYIDHLYSEYGKTIRFWRKDNFKYYGTACVAREIRRAFNNDDIKSIYNEQQEFLQKIVDLNEAELERRNSRVINIVGVLLALFQIRDYIVKDFLAQIYLRFPDGWIADVEAEASRTFNVLVFGGFLVAFLVVNLMHKRNYYDQMRKLISESGLTDDEDR